MGLELWRGGVESNDVIAGGCSTGYQQNLPRQLT